MWLLLIKGGLCMTSIKTTSKKPLLEELIFGALSQLQMLKYNDRSIRRYQSTWRRLIKFSKKHNFKNKLSEKLILEFLSYHDIKPELPTYMYKDWRRHAEFSLKILWNYARFGYFERLMTTLNKLNIPPIMLRILHEYKKYCEEKRHLSSDTVSEYARQIGLFLDFLGKRNITTFDKIQAVDLSDFVYSLSRFSQKTIASTVSYVRLFTKFLFFRNKLKTDLSQALPSIYVPRHGNIPSVWDRELVMQLLNAVDRGSPRGKRDYAILLLACRLGLRMSDIRLLTLDHINWETETISIIQVKTKNPLCLPLTNEVGNALIDYIQFVRPVTNCREVFLRLKPPFIPFSNHALYAIISYWREMAGIKFKSRQRKGLQSLRHSLATYLLEDNTPFAVIADILGHTSINTTMIYAKTSVEILRQVALSIKEVGHDN